MTARAKKHEIDLPDTDEEMLCAGLPFIGVRTLEADELRDVQKYQQRLNSWAFALYFFSVFLGLGLLMIPVEMGDPRPNDSAVMSALRVAAVLLIFVATWPAAIARNRQSRAKWLTSIRACGKVRCFEGTIPRYEWTGLAAKALIRAKLIDPKDASPCRIEVLPDLDRVYAINEKPVRKLLAIGVTRGAGRPRDAVELAMPQGWVPDDLQEKVERRRMSPAEHDEIMGYLKIGPRFWVSVCAFVYFTACILRLVLQDFSHYGQALSIAAAFLIAMSLAVRRFRPLFRNRRKMRMDSQFGWIFIVPPKPPTDDESETPSETIHREFLPVSGLAWTVEGKPAAWRKKAAQNK